MSSEAIRIRQGNPEDCDAVFALIRELAEFEKAPHEVVNTAAELREHAFGQNPVCGFLVAEVDGSIVGTSLYYVRYSTWKGPCLYLEDLIVTEKMRGKGIGSALFTATMELSRAKGYRRMNFQVLDWNTPAI